MIGKITQDIEIYCKHSVTAALKDLSDTVLSQLDYAKTMKAQNAHIKSQSLQGQLDGRIVACEDILDQVNLKIERYSK